MATAAEIVVKVIDSTSQGVRSANQNLNKLGQQSGTTAVGIKNLNARLVGIGASLASGGAVLLGLGNYLDVLQNLENRLKVTGVGQEELNDVFNRLSEVANEARAPLGETIELYSRLALASESVGLSQKEVITVTENFSKILAIGGATTAEAQGAMIQFSQALASGKVQMQELNPLLDSAPIFIQQLEKQLGLTRAELREFVSKGLITSEIAARALIQATEDLDAQFGQTQQTIGQASTKLSNSFLLMIKEFDDVIGASDLFASAINLAAENVEAFSVASGTIAAGAIAALAVAFGVISLPLAAIITAVAAAAAAFVAWGDDIVVFMSDALEPVIEGFNNLKSTVKDMANNVVLKFNEMKVGIVSSLGTAGAYVDAFFAGVAAGFTDPLNAADAFSKAFETTLVGALAEAEKATASYEKELENARKTVEDSTESVKDNSDEVKDNTDEVKDNTKATEDHTDEEEDNTDAVDDNTDAQDDNKTAAELLQEQLRRNENQVKAVTGAYSDFSDELERSVDLARLDSAEREIQTEIQRGLEAQAKALGKQVKDLTDIEVANVKTYVREQVVKRQSAERTADDLQEFDRETQKIIEENYKNTTDAVKQLEDEKQEYIANARALGLENAKSTQDAMLAYDQLIADEQKKLNDERIKDFVDAAEKYRSDEMTATDIYVQKRLELQQALDDGIILSEEDRIDYLRSINEDYIDGITSEYDDLYGFFEGKIRDMTGLTRQEFGIMEEVVQLVFGANVTDIIQGTFATGIGAITGFRTSGNSELGGFAQDTNTPFSTIGGIIDGTFGANSIGLGSIGTFVVAGFELLGGLASDIFSLFGGVGDFLGNTFGGAFKSISGAISGLFGGGGGGGSGGIFTALGSVFGPVGGIVGGIVDFFFADGGYIAPGGVGIVGEAGPELVSGPAYVTSAKDTASMLGSSGGNVNVNFSIQALDSRGVDELLTQRKGLITDIVRSAVEERPNRTLRGVR